MILSTLALLAFQSGHLDQVLQDAAAHAEKGNFGAAVTLLEKAGVDGSNNAAALTRLGVYMLRSTEAQIASGALRGLMINDAFLAAADLLEQAADLDDATPEAYENWSEALLNGGDKRNALRAAEAGIKRHPQELAPLLQRARVHVADANDSADPEKKIASFKAAIKDYDKAVKMDRKAVAPCLLQGQTVILEAYAHGDKGDPGAARKQAAKSWSEALKRDQAAVNLSKMCEWLGSEAVPLLEKIDKSGGEDATMQWYMGYAEFSVAPRNWDRVRARFERSLELEPGITNCWFFLAQGAFDEGVRIQAEGEGERADRAYRYAARAWGEYLISNGPTHRASVLSGADGGAGAIATLKWLAGKAVMRGEFEPAIRINLWITQSTPADVESWNNLAFLYRDSGKAEKALPAYAQAARLSPEDPQVLNDWAVIYHYYLKTEDKKAEDLYQKAITMAEEILSDPVGLASEEETRIRIGLRDARNNLAKLQRGDRHNG